MDLEGALLCFQKAAALKPENVDAQYYMGIVYERFTQNSEALEHYLKAGELDPNNPQYAVAAAEMALENGSARLDDLLPKNCRSGPFTKGMIRGAGLNLRRMWQTSPQQWVNKLRSLASTR